MPSHNPFPTLRLADWQPTRDAIHRYAQVLGRIRGALTPRQRHWWHISLCVSEDGLGAPPIPIAQTDQTFTLLLDLRHHVLQVAVPSHPTWTLPLAVPWSQRAFSQQILDGLTTAGIDVTIDRAAVSDETPLNYDPAAAERYCTSLVLVDEVFKQFQAELPGETSPVQLWPHHFDLALTWLTGRKVPGFDEGDEEWADEQMGFGFATGDATFPDAYFYITAYPWPPALDADPLKRPARWVQKGWKGAILPYTHLTRRRQPATLLRDFLSSTQQMAMAAMAASPQAR